MFAPGRDDELLREVEEAAGFRNAADYRMVELPVSALADGSWQMRGCLTPQAFLVWGFGVSSGVANAAYRLARRAEELPNTMDGVRRGWLSLEKASIIARHSPSEYEVSTSQMARRLSISQMRRVLREYFFDADADDEFAKARPTPTDGVQVRDLGFGKSRISITCSTDDSRVLVAALDQAKARLLDVSDLDGVDDPDMVNQAQADGLGEVNDPTRRFPSSLEALMEVFRMANLNDPSDARRQAHLVSVHCDLKELLNPAASGFVGHYALGGYIDHANMERLLCDGDVEVFIENGGVPLGHARRRRNPSPQLRRAVLHRDGHCCAFPGCERTKGLTLHHLTFWGRGGHTETWNLLTLCTRHHTLLHQGVFQITGNPDKPDTLEFTTGPTHHSLRSPDGVLPKLPVRPILADHDYLAEGRGQRIDRKWFALRPLRPPGPVEDDASPAVPEWPPRPHHPGDAELN